MTVTTSTSLADSVKPYYDADYELACQSRLYWAQMTYDKVGKGLERGSTLEFVIYSRLDPATTALTETADVTPVEMSDAAVSVTLTEYGNAVQQSMFLRATAYTDVEKAAAEAIGYNAGESIDMIIRNLANAGSRVLYAAGAARNTLQAANKATVAFFHNLRRVAAYGRTPSFSDGSYVTVVHSNLEYDLINDQIIERLSTYSDPSIILNGEIGKISGIRLLQSITGGKVFWGAGVAAVAATTLNGAITAGATTATLTTDAGLAVGDRIVLGTIETGGTAQDTTEEVEILTLPGANVVTFRGDGNAENNLGCRYAHGNGAAVNKAANVYGVPVIGPKSICYAYSDVRGPHGEVVLSGPFDVLGRLYNTGWHLIGGWGRSTERWLLRGECSGTY